VQHCRCSVCWPCGVSTSRVTHCGACQWTVGAVDCCDWSRVVVEVRCECLRHEGEKEQNWQGTPSITGSDVNVISMMVQSCGADACLDEI
jgi:hypothetical protein